jgi:hypothetical protein
MRNGVAYTRGHQAKSFSLLEKEKMRFARMGSAACLCILALLMGGCALSQLKATSGQASGASQNETLCPQSNDMSCAIAADPAVQPDQAKASANCRRLPKEFDPEKDSKICPANNVWATGARGEGYQCCKKPPV